MVRATIYTAPKCPHSENLKRFLSEAGVQFEEICVFRDEQTLSTVKERTGQMGVPVTIVDENIFVGFDKRTERRLKRTLGV